MLTDLWNCFEATGDITTYLNFKAYEEDYIHLNSVAEPYHQESDEVDRMKKP